MADLLTDTRRLLAAALEDENATVTKIAADNEVSLRWLQMFRDGEIANPGVVTVQRLHSYLSSARPDARA